MQKNTNSDISKINYQQNINFSDNVGSSQNFNSQARPIVDPEAEGTVDPNLYPEPKEATHKIRSKNDFIEFIFGSVDQELLTVKTFYFFFYSAFGSLFPLMGVYFKQMGMNAGQCGLLIGLRPFIEFFSAPFWGSLADRWRKGKLILLASLACWILFTLPLGFIQPPPTSCMILKNSTSILDLPESEKKIVKRFMSAQEKHFTNEKNLVVADLKIVKNLIDKSAQSTLKEKKKIFSHKSHLFRAFNFEESQYGSSTRLKLGNHGALESFSEDPVEKKSSVKSILENENHSIKRRNTVKVSGGTSNSTTSNSNDMISTTNLLIDNIKKKMEVHSTPELKFEENKRVLTTSSQKKTVPKLEVRSTKVLRNVRAVPIETGQSPLSVSNAVNYQEKKHKDWVKPAFSSIVYKLPDIQKTFFLLLLMVVVGEFFSAPAITLADSAVITLLGEDSDRYGHQRMFGSLGWGVAMFFVGIALDHSTAFPEHPCGPNMKEKNYTICFAIFSVLMGGAFITATQINFKYDPVEIGNEVTNSLSLPTKEEQLQSQLSQQLNLPSLQEPSASNDQHPPQEKTKIFAQTTREIPEWLTVLKEFEDLKCVSFLFVAWFMGFGIGLIFTFLFWHLQDYGGTPTLFGVASVINHISEIFAYFFSFKLIQEFGHVKVLCMGLLGNVIRFLYISWLKNPWWVLPFEFIQGITHATVWAACCSYIAHNTPAPLRSSAQGVLQGLHHGLGRGCGAVVGGIFVAVYGTTTTFRIYGLMCLLVLGAFIFINFYHKDHGFISNLPPTEDPHQVAEVTHLAPHGVPSNAIPRALSSHRLHELANQDLTYGSTYDTTGGNLHPPQDYAAPDTKNPFLREARSSKYDNLVNTGNDNFIRKSFENYSEILSPNYGSNKCSTAPTYVNDNKLCTNPFHQHEQKIK